MAPKPKAPPMLSRERLVELMGSETAEELFCTARGEHVDSAVMSVEEFERWTLTGEGNPWPDSSE